jgi:hypothetical protein
MSNMNIRKIRMLAGAAVGALTIAGAANAQTYTLTPGFSSLYVDPTFVALGYKTLEIPTGVTGWLVSEGANANWAVGTNTAITINSNGIYDYSTPPGHGAANMSTLNPCQNSGLAYNATLPSCLSKAPVLQVDTGGTLKIGGTQTQSWMIGGYGFENAIHADGTVIIEYAGPTQSWGTPTQQFVGTNAFLGDVVLSDIPAPMSASQVTATFGLSWAPGMTQFGPNTNIILGTNTILDIYQAPTASLAMGGSLQGTGELRLSSGTLFINGANTAATPFHGNLNIRPGNTVIIGDVAHQGAVIGDPGNVSSYTLTLAGAIAGGGNLRGFGTVAGNVVNIASVVRPGYGNDLGTLTVLGNYTQDAVGTLRVQVTPTGASTLHVVGNAAVDGTLNIAIAPGAYQTQIYDVLTVDGTLTGNFSSIVTDSVQGAIGAVTKTAHGYSVVTQVVQGASATAPLVVGHLADANRLNDYYLVGALYDQIAQDTARNQTEIGRNKYAWIEGFGHVSSISRNDVGYHTDAEGVRAGVEYRNETNATIGLAMSYSTGSLKAKGDSTAKIDTWHVAAYGGYDVQYMRLDGVLFYDTYSTTAKRDFGADGVAESSPDGYSYGASIQVSHSLMHDLLTPYVRGIYSRQHVGASVETGAPLLNLRYDAISRNLFVADLGFRINPLRALPESKTKLLLTVALEHDFSPLGELVNGTFPVTNGQNWFTYWRGDSENTLLLGVDVARKITDKLEISGRVNGRMSKFQSSGELALSAKYRF